MPHLVLEGTQNAVTDNQVQPLLDDLVELFCGLPTVSSNAVKARFYRVDRWCTGHDAPPEFLHCGIWLMTGREAIIKEQFVEEVFEFLKSRYAEAYEKGWISLTVELREMSKEFYRK